MRIYNLIKYHRGGSQICQFQFFENLRFGIVEVSDINPTAAAAPLGGMQDSGPGREGGKEGIREYLENKLGGFSV